ncbi:FixH family protein [Nitratireductor alexandrii]|uniref:FixH family protein n=1 Tax=Nitratireductor alexandrii TaxID=2448161 RepID=UPI000FD9A775|nr:FixH family protein [Nitratireductor alexandrii]
MSRFLVALVAAAVLALGVIYFYDPGGTGSETLDLARSKPTVNGLYVVAIAPEAEPVETGELHGWVLTLTVPDGTPVEDAQIEVGGGMPDHGHGLPTSPEMTAYLGDGRYRIHGVRFNMGGWWVLDFTVRAEPGEDTVRFNIRL